VDIASAVDTLNPKWKVLLSQELKSQSFKDLQTFLSQQRETIYPSIDNVFNTYNLLDPEDIKVVILGQDPYHDVDQAHGLAFSVENVQKLPPSLKNIFKELADDLNVDIPTNGNLVAWVKQGVFLLNAVLTVKAHEANSHKGRGWENFTDATIKAISENCENVVFILWGGSAQKKASLINSKKHFVLSSAHPSPLSVYRGFWKSRPFSQTNDYLISHHKKPIEWAL